MLRFLSILIFALVARHHVNAADTGGVQIRLSSKGLQYGASVGMKVIMRELKKVKIPNQGQSKDIGIGDIRWSATNLHIAGVSIPRYSIKPLSGGKLRVSVSGVSVGAGGSLSGGVQMKGVCVPYPCGWLKWCKKCVRPPGINLGMGVSVRASSISFTLDFDVKTASGKPTVRATYCNARLPSISVSLSNKVLGVVYNAIAPVLKHFLTPIIQNAVCAAAKGAVNGIMNSALGQFPTAINIDNNARINYELRRVSGTSDYFDLISRGEFQSRRNPGSSGLQMVSFPQSSNSNKMVYIWVSDFTVNSFGKVYHDAGLFKFVVDSKFPHIPKEVGMFLNTATLGAFFPDLQKKYPNRPMQFRAASFKAPTFHFSPGSAQANIFVAANFDVVTATGPVPAFWLKLSIVAKGSVSITSRAEKIKANIQGFTFKAEIGGYTLGKFNLPLDGPEVKGIVQMVIAMVNPVMGMGFPLPSIPGVVLQNGAITFVQNAVRVEADMNVAI